jgi:hypothetical protein
MDLLTIIVISAAVIVSIVILIINAKGNAEEAKKSLRKRGIKGFFRELLNHIGISFNKWT